MRRVLANIKRVVAPGKFAVEVGSFRDADLQNGEVARRLVNACIRRAVKVTRWRVGHNEA